MINFDKIEHIYGKSIIDSIYNMKEDVMKNFEYFYKLGFDNAEDIFERQAIIFICEHNEFKNKINNLLNELGVDYIEVIEEDISILDKLL